MTKANFTKLLYYDMMIAIQANKALNKEYLTQLANADDDCLLAVEMLLDLDKEGFISLNNYEKLCIKGYIDEVDLFSNQYRR